MPDGATTERVQLLEEALALARGDGDVGNISAHLAWLAWAVQDTGDLDRARALAAESGVLALRAGDPSRRIMPAIQLGLLDLAQDRLDEAEARFRTAADVGGLSGVWDWHGLLGLGLVSLRRNQPEQARALSRRALMTLRELSPESANLAAALAYTAHLDADRGFHERAQRLLGAYEAWYTTRGGLGRTWRLLDWGALIGRQVPLPPPSTDPTLARARAEGRTMSLEEAVNCALEPVEPYASDGGFE